MSVERIEMVDDYGAIGAPFAALVGNLYLHETNKAEEPNDIFLCASACLNPRAETSERYDHARALIETAVNQLSIEERLSNHDIDLPDQNPRSLCHNPATHIVLAVSDDQVIKAVRYFTEHGYRGPSVSDDETFQAVQSGDHNVKIASFDQYTGNSDAKPIVQPEEWTWEQYEGVFVRILEGARQAVKRFVEERLQESPPALEGTLIVRERHFEK